jgi:hypothetical protein
MKTLLLALFTFMLAGPAWAVEPAGRPRTDAPEATLKFAANYLDQIFVSTLASLESVAATPEAKQGDWYGIKRYLKRIEAELPGVYFYVLPNGDYYSIALDFTRNPPCWRFPSVSMARWLAPSAPRSFSTICMRN